MNVDIKYKPNPEVLVSIQRNNIESPEMIDMVARELAKIAKVNRKAGVNIKVTNN